MAQTLLLRTDGVGMAMSDMGLVQVGSLQKKDRLGSSIYAGFKRAIGRRSKFRVFDLITPIRVSPERCGEQLRA